MSRPHLGKLMGRYDTRQLEVDQLFRGDRLVDLYQVVRQGLRASVESYSIKRLEPLYGFSARSELRDAGTSIAAFERWLRMGGIGGVGRGPPGRHRGLQPRRRPLDLEAARLAGGASVELGRRLGEALPRPEVKSGEADDGASRGWLAQVEEVAGPLRDRRARWTAASRPGRRGAAGRTPAGRPAGLASARAEARLVALLPPAPRPDGRGAPRREGAPGAARAHRSGRTTRARFRYAFPSRSTTWVARARTPRRAESHSRRVGR